MSDTLPDRLDTNPRSKFYDAELPMQPEYYGTQVRAHHQIAIADA